MIDRRSAVLGLAGARDEYATTSCTRCGRGAPQPGNAGRFGLSAQLAQAFEFVDRLEQCADALRHSLHSELTNGIERHVASVRADAAAVIVAAHTERDLARQEAEAARHAHQQTRRDLALAEESTRRTRASATQAVQAAKADQARAQEQAESAMSALSASEAELAALRARLEAAEAERDASRAELRDAQEQLAVWGERAGGLAAELARFCVPSVNPPSGGQPSTNPASAGQPSAAPTSATPSTGEPQVNPAAPGPPNDPAPATSCGAVNPS